MKQHSSRHMHYVCLVVAVSWSSERQAWLDSIAVAKVRGTYPQCSTSPYMGQHAVVSIDRWSFCTGGPSVQVVLPYRWSFCTGGPSVQVVLPYRWSFCAGGPSVQVVLLYRWSFYTGGPSVQMAIFTRYYHMFVIFLLCTDLTGSH